MIIPDILLGIIVGFFLYHVMAKKLLNSPKYQKYKSFLGILKKEIPKEKDKDE